MWWCSFCVNFKTRTESEKNTTSDKITSLGTFACILVYTFSLLSFAYLLSLKHTSYSLARHQVLEVHTLISVHLSRHSISDSKGKALHRWSDELASVLELLSRLEVGVEAEEGRADRAEAERQ